MEALHTCARLSGTSISGWEPCPTRYHSVAEGPLPVAFRSCHGAPGRVSSVGIALSAKPEANHFPVKNSIFHLPGESPWVPASAAMPLASSEPAPLIYYFVFLPDDNENLSRSSFHAAFARWRANSRMNGSELSVSIVADLHWAFSFPGAASQFAYSLKTNRILDFPKSGFSAMDTLYNRYSLKIDTFLVKQRAISYKGVYCSPLFTSFVLMSTLSAIHTADASLRSLIGLH